MDNNTFFIKYEKEIIKEFTLCDYCVQEVYFEYMSVAAKWRENSSNKQGGFIDNYRVSSFATRSTYSPIFRIATNHD
jgi:hypothetical protein